jgi:putative photosynthetic complex assembly protein
MSKAADPSGIEVPRAVLLCAAALLAFALATAAWSAHERHDHRAAAGVAAALEVRFEDRADGSIAVLEARSGREVSVVPPRSNGFIRGVLRGLNRGRRQESIERTASFRLVRFQDGRLSLEDPQTRREIDLGAFGATNQAAFAQLLDASLQAVR